jgi:hypothetical protein
MKSKVTDTIDEGNELFEPRGLVGADQTRNLRGWAMSGYPAGRGLCRTDRNLARRDECGGGQHNNKMTPFSSAQIFAFQWGWLLLRWLSSERGRCEDTQGGAGGKSGGKSPPIIAR